MAEPSGRRPRRTARVLLVLGCAAPALLATGTAQAATRAIPFDVDGNGVADLVVGVPGEAIGDTPDAGAVSVTLAGEQGIGTRSYALDQAVAGIKGSPESGDRYGSAIASGDFDADGYADLAVGVSGEALGSTAAAGAVSVVYGAATYPSARDQFWSQDDEGVPGFSEVGDRFGAAVAVGDLDGDGFDDLAVGASSEDIGSAEDAGAVTVLYGSSTGLTAARASSWNQDVPGIAEDAEPFDEVDTDLHRGKDRFGAALAVGDTTGDGRAELAIGVPNESVERAGGYVGGGGAVHLLLGRAGGITAAGSQYWTQDSDGILDQAEEQENADRDPQPGDAFGSALAIGDVDADGRGDLAVGIPREEVRATIDEGPHLNGAVALLRGSADGVTAAGNQFLHKDTPGVPGVAGNYDELGSSLALGDLDGDGKADLAVGAPGDSPDVDSHYWGAVVVLPGSSAGLTPTGSQSWSQRTPGVPGISESFDMFGDRLSIGQYGRGPQADLAVGVTGENGFSGQVNTLYGSPDGLTTDAANGYTQNSPGVPGVAEAGDTFGVVR